MVGEQGQNGIWKPCLRNKRANSQMEVSPLQTRECDYLPFEVFKASGYSTRAFNCNLTDCCGENAPPRPVE
jgi:hypothetical protein